MSERPKAAEALLLAKLRSGDEIAFASLVDDLHGGLLAFAKTFTSSSVLAEDIVQETWLAVIRGLHAFEARASIKTWVYSILARRARTIAARDARQNGARPQDVLRSPDVEWEPGQGRRGLWEETPEPWVLEDPAAVYQSREVLEVLLSALHALPSTQRQVVLLRDVEGLPAEEVCNILDLSETNQRVTSIGGGHGCAGRSINTCGTEPDHHSLSHEVGGEQSSELLRGNRSDGRRPRGLSRPGIPRGL